MVADGATTSAVLPVHAGVHAAHATLRGRENAPAPHAAHGVVAFMSVSAVPAAHAYKSHVPLLPAGAYVPAGHVTHTAAPPSPAVPPGHAWHTRSDVAVGAAALNWPARHSPVRGRHCLHGEDSQNNNPT